jgi:hypothetical protein
MVHMNASQRRLRGAEIERVIDGLGDPQRFLAVGDGLAELSDFREGTASEKRA